MTLADELMGLVHIPIPSIKPREVVGDALRLPFNGELSPDELRMAEQFAFDGPASWEVN